MSKSEVFEKMMNSENGGLYAVIGGIVVAYGIDRITKYHYRADVKKDSVVVEPAADNKTATEPEKTPDENK